MDGSVNEASRWRRELAGELAAFYSSHAEVRMVCLGGSAARGIADQWSDIDMIVYWNELDSEWIRSRPLPFPRTDLALHPAGTAIESYHFDGLKVDFGHVRLSDWEEWVKPLLSRSEPELDMIESVGGFLSSLVFHGETEYNRLESLFSSYPPSLSRHVILKNLSFFVKGYLAGQCYERGDIPAYHEGMQAMLKKLVNIIAALNGYWYYAGEFRWLRHHIGRMALKPQGFSWDSLVWILDNPGPQAVAMLDDYQDSILSMVAERFPELAGRVEKRRTRTRALAVRPSFSRPSQSGI